jgi:hypothetical protein
MLGPLQMLLHCTLKTLSITSVKVENIRMCTENWVGGKGVRESNGRG